MTGHGEKCSREPKEGGGVSAWALQALHDAGSSGAFWQHGFVVHACAMSAQVELGQARKVTEKERPAQPASLQQQPAAVAAAKPPGREGLKPVRSSQNIGSGK